MTLPLYLFRQFFSPFLFGAVLFLFVLLLDKLFDIVDLIFNKGVNAITVLRLFSLFIPTVIPLTLPMAVLLACLITFGRMSEENELTAIRAAGVQLGRVLWIVPAFVLLLSIALVPFNTNVAPWSSRAFRLIYERVMQSDPLINIEPHRFFTIKNIKIYADRVDKEDNRMTDLFVYQMKDEGPPDRIFAAAGIVSSDSQMLKLRLESGQMQQLDELNPRKMLHTTFGTYEISIPLNLEEAARTTRYRSISSRDLGQMISDLKKQGLPTAPLEAEHGLRFALAFAPICLVLVGMPLGTALKRGGKTFSFGITIVLIFLYYLLLIFGLTLAEKGKFPAHPALWIGNVSCLVMGIVLSIRMLRK